MKSAWRALRKTAPHMLLDLRAYRDVLRCSRANAERQFFCLDFEGTSMWRVWDWRRGGSPGFLLTSCGNA